MRNYLIKAAIWMILVFTLMACEKKTNRITASGNVTTEFRDISGYTELEVNDAFEVEVNFTDVNQPVEIIANENLHPYIELVKSADRLSVGLQNNISISGEAQLKVVLSTGYLTAYTANGASLIRLMDTLRSDQAVIILTGASKMSGPMVLQDLSVDVRSASLLDIAGETPDLRIMASGASRMSGYAFNCVDLEADLLDASEVELTVNGKINIKATGASILRYKGSGTIESQDLRDASTVIKTD